MHALPRLETEQDQPTGITCPDCPGVLEVRSHNGHLRFQCRIGHTYSLQELIESKEEHLEALLWAPVTALDELAALLSDVVAQGQGLADPQQLEERAVRAKELAERIRDLIEQNQPTNLSRTAEPNDT